MRGISVVNTTSRYIDGTVVLVDLYPQLVPDGGKVIWLWKVTQTVVFHRILQYNIAILLVQSSFDSVECILCKYCPVTCKE